MDKTKLAEAVAALLPEYDDQQASVIINGKPKQQEALAFRICSVLFEEYGHTINIISTSEKDLWRVTFGCESSDKYLEGYGNSFLKAVSVAVLDWHYTQPTNEGDAE